VKVETGFAISFVAFFCEIFVFILGLGGVFFLKNRGVFLCRFLFFFKLLIFILFFLSALFPVAYMVGVPGALGKISTFYLFAVFVDVFVLVVTMSIPCSEKTDTT